VGQKGESSQEYLAQETFSPLAELLPNRTAPELLYLDAKWCSLLSFGVSCDLLAEVLPLGDELNTMTLRNNLHRVTEQRDDRHGVRGIGGESVGE